MTWKLKLNNRKTKKKYKRHIFNMKTQKFFIKLLNEYRFTITKSGFITNNRTGKTYDRIGDNGYIDVAVRYNGTIFHILAHRLIWLYFKGWLDENDIINHRDGIKHHNFLSNLEKTDFNGNAQHAWDNGLCKNTPVMQFRKKIGQKGERSTSAKLTNEQAQEIRVIYAKGGITHRKLGKLFNISSSCITRIINNQYYKKGFYLKLNRRK